jgi:hypothetical protein
VTLERVSLLKTAGTSAVYNEAWLQDLLMRHPSILPVGRIEPAFEGMVPICRELPMSSGGFLDNLFMTKNGDLALIECKLWRNPEARREVIAQILEYARDMAGWSFEDLEKAVNRTEALSGHPKTGRRLYELVGKNEDVDEASFHDAISRNLTRGRFLLLIVGDGIQERMAAMSDFLQEHAGFHFTLGFVELSLFKSPNGFIVQPRVLARTENIPRAIVKIEEGRIVVTAAEPLARGITSARRTTGITEELFYETLEKNCPGVGKKLENFLDELSEYGIRREFGTESLVLRWRPDEGKAWNLGTITKKGEVWTDFLGQQAKATDLLREYKLYLSDLAVLVPDAVVRETPNEAHWFVSVNGKIVKVDALLADGAREKGWKDAIQRFQSAASPQVEPA